MRVSRNDLPQKVQAVNMCHKALCKYVPIVKDTLRPFIGQKIVKKDRQLTAKMKAILDSVLKAERESKNIHCLYVKISYRTIWLVCSVCVSDEQGTTYHEETVYIGDLNFDKQSFENGDCLESIAVCTYDAKTDYTVEYVEQQNSAIQAMDIEIKSLQASIRPFVE